jgi:hypothetical protein
MLLIIVVLFTTVSYKIAENFSNIDNPYTKDKQVHEYVNAHLLDHSRKCNDKNEESYLQSLLCGQHCATNAIKYVEGCLWTQWDTTCNDIVKDIEKKVYMFLKRKINSKMLYCKVNRVRKNAKKCTEYMVDYDFVYHNKGMYAFHVNLICIVNLNKQCIKMVHVYLVGCISEDKIHMKMSAGKDNIVEVPRMFRHVSDTSFEEDSHISMSTHDDQVKDILYEKLNDFDETDEDYQKNIEYTKNQNIVRNLFLKDLKKHQTNTEHKNYKLYPYKDDFEICILPS